MSEQQPKHKNKLADLAVFAVFILSAVVLLIENILPLFKVEVSGGVMKTLSTIQQVSILVGVALGARRFAKHTNKLFKFIYFLGILVYLVAIILAFFGK